MDYVNAIIKDIYGINYHIIKSSVHVKQPELIIKSKKLILKPNYEEKKNIHSKQPIINSQNSQNIQSE